jgi:two-component system, NtrC family, sensor histidine kinase HydH
VTPKRPRILLVDDNEALIANLEEILDDGGYEVLPARTAAAALERARTGFEVALVDLRLPDGSGTTLAPRLKEVSPEGEIVLLTGFATLETAIAAVRAGAFAYLVKPCATPELLLTIEQALRQVRLHGEKRELARRAQVAEKLAAVGTMTAGLSHEIRNPLNAAGLQLVVLERGIRRLPPESQPKLLEPLTLVRDEIKRLEHLLEDFLQFARPRELIARPVFLAEPLDAVLGLLSGDAQRRGIAIEREGEPGLAVAGDGERLRQVLMNLALNALEATPAGGRVRVSAHLDRDMVIISVEDSGPGIAAATRERIFEPFFTTKAGGSGLGLPMVHAIVTQHGGTIAVDTSVLGGARFELRLPALSSEGT